MTDEEIAAQIVTETMLAVQHGVSVEEIRDTIVKMAEAGKKAQIAGTAWRIVINLIEDISDRRGLKREWAKIDDDVKEEIMLAWAKIIDEGITND
jgi:hypothetical protein